LCLDILVGVCFDVDQRIVIQEAVATPSDEGYCQLVSDESDLLEFLDMREVVPLG
jgi:hypothetical protein